MSIKDTVRNTINRNSLMRKWFVAFCARFTIRLFTLQRFLSISDLKGKLQMAAWRRVLASLEELRSKRSRLQRGRPLLSIRTAVLSRCPIPMPRIAMRCGSVQNTKEQKPLCSTGSSDPVGLRSMPALITVGMLSIFHGSWGQMGKSLPLNRCPTPFRN